MFAEPVMRGTCTERAHLRLFSMMTNLENWFSFEVLEVPWFLRSLKLTAADIHRQLVEVMCVQTTGSQIVLHVYILQGRYDGGQDEAPRKQKSNLHTSRNSFGGADA